MNMTDPSLLPRLARLQQGAARVPDCVPPLVSNRRLHLLPLGRHEGAAGGLHWHRGEGGQRTTVLSQSESSCNCANYVDTCTYMITCT